MKLGEVCLLTSDVPRLAAFYRALMELPDASDDPVHQFITEAEPALAIFNDGLMHSAERSPVSLAFTTDDICADYEKLLSMNVKIVQPPMKQPWGTVNLLFRDPDGNLVYLRQFSS